MKFGQLIECNTRNIFLEKSYRKCGGGTSSRPFSGKLQLSISLDQWSKSYTVCSGSDILNFELNLIFLIKPFFNMTKML